MTFILLLILKFNAFAQNDIYSFTDKKTNGTPTVRLSPDLFLYYKSLTSASNVKTQQEFSDATSRNRDQVTQTNIIPIGILNAEIDIPDEKEKKKDFVLMASPIQKDIFQAKVQFQLSPKLLHTNLDNQIESIEISFDNGDNWKTYKYAEQLISYQFSKIGEQPIGFRINSKKGTYVTFAMVDVKQLVRPSFVEPKRVSAPAIKGGRMAAGVNGAEYRIIMGCDGIFDKPVIIAEGFDVGNNTNLDDLTAKYFNALELYRNNGYDLVLVNYDNGRTWIQDNAQVLKAVINQVNATKVGSNRLVVIGESMSGLVARWALREMENAGQNPNVSHFVAFDTPMRGANVPTGLIALRRSEPDVPLAIAGFYFNLPEVYAIDSPAARQMLLTQQGTSPAPEFFEFQTQINNLGYPSQFGIKNVALINGALNGTPQRRYIAQDNGNGTYTEIDQGLLNQGDPIFDFSVFLVSRDRVWTHTINNSSLVYQRTRLGNQEVIFANNLPLNYDRQPGGRIVANTGSVYTSFSFVPTFSAIDYRGTLNNDNDYYFNIRNFINGGNNQVTNAALTPFAAIYGNDENNFHAIPSTEREAFNTFGRIELGMINNGCIGCTAGSGGLAGTYFDNVDLTNNGNTRTGTHVVNFSSDNNLTIPANGINSTSNISARWEGSVEAPITATYTFNIRTDDGVRLWFDGIQKVDDFGYYSPKDHTFNVPMNAGERKNIRIEWRQGGGGYEAKFMWSLNGVETFVPACRLFPTSITPTGCSFTVSANANPSSVGCGGSSLLTAGCSGAGCGGVTYSWSGNGSNYSGSPVNVTLPNSNGSVGYTLTGSKPGCSNQTVNTSVTVSGCGGGTTGCVINKVKLAYRGGDLNNGCCFDRLVGSKIQGSNNNSSWTDLYTFNTAGNGSLLEYTFSNTTSYNYVRFQGGSNSFGELSQLEFYNGSALLTGTGFGTENYANALDSSPNTYWHGSSSGSQNTAGLQLSGCTTGGGGGGSCSYTDGQFLTDWYGEIVNAYRCGSKYYATSTGGAYKPKSWLIATGRFSAAEYNCFEQDDPRPAGCATGGGGGTGGGGTGGGGTGGGGCTFTDGQFLLTYNGETIQAKFCNGVLYARATWGAWKHPNWLISAGMNSTTAACFATSNPGCGALRVSAEKLSDETDDKITVYPNPTTGKIKIVFSLQKAENVWLNLYDVQGKSLDLRDFEGKVGRNEMEYDLQNYSSGSYFVDFQSAEKREILKVMKVN